MGKIKVGLLACLVILSMMLFFLVIFGQQGPTNRDGDAMPWFGPRLGLHEIILPSRIYVNTLEGHILQIETFSQMYTDLVLTLGQMEHADEPGDWVAAVFGTELSAPGVFFRFDYRVSRGTLTAWLTRFYETDFPFAFIDGIFVPADGGPVLCIDSFSGQSWKLLTDLPSSVFQQAVADPRNQVARLTAMVAGEDYTVASNVFDLLEPQPLIAPVCSPEEVEVEEIINSFFLNPSVIQEADGTKTYTDGFGALRVFPSGMLEYTGAFQGQGDINLNQPQTVQAALDFLQAHGGWPGNMLPAYLCDRPSEPTELEFGGFGRGLPIVGEYVGIAIDIQQGQVTGYRRHLLGTGREAQIASVAKPLSQLLSSNSQAAQYFSEGNRHIVDLVLVHYWLQERLVPAWKVEVEGCTVFVAANDGRVIHIRSRLGGR